MKLSIPIGAQNAACNHAIAVYPAESCGLVVNGLYVPCKNIAADPLKDFEISADEQMEAMKLGAIQAIVHSHPNGPLFPSQRDMASQIASGVPWIIIPTNGNQCGYLFEWGDGIEMQPLIGREFRHGVTDCYALIRDYYRTELNISLPEFPRDDAWWAAGDNLYVEGFSKAGFRAIERDKVQKHDVFLAHIHSQVPNHGGVYLGDSQIIHHLPQRLSMRSPIGIWIHSISHWLRHESFE